MAKDHDPGIKDDERYEALRRQGASKEKAARIANTDPSKAGKRGGSAPRYDEWSRDDLYHRAAEIGIENRSKMNKQQLIDALRNRSEEHTSELQSLMRISYAVFCLKKKTKRKQIK